MARVKPGKGKGGKSKGKTAAKPKSRASKVRSKCLVGKIAHLMNKGGFIQKVGVGGSVVIAYVLEILAEEVLELVGTKLQELAKNIFSVKWTEQREVVPEETSNAKSNLEGQDSSEGAATNGNKAE